MSLWRTKLVSSPVALYASWVGHRDVLVWTLSGRQYQRCVLEEISELQDQDVFLSPIMGGIALAVFPLSSIDRCVQHGPGFPDLAGRGANPHRSRIHLLKSFLLYIVFCSCSISIPVAFFIFVQKFICPPR